MYVQWGGGSLSQKGGADRSQSQPNNGLRTSYVKVLGRGSHKRRILPLTVSKMLAQTLGLAILVMIIAWFLSVDNGWLGGRASVGTFNTLLIRGAPVFQERKELLIETVSYIYIKRVCWKRPVVGPCP